MDTAVRVVRIMLVEVSWDYNFLSYLNCTDMHDVCMTLYVNNKSDKLKQFRSPLCPTGVDSMS
jgi:hypothetical protein